MRFNLPWMVDALCAQIGPADSLFFPESRCATSESAQAKELCLSCPVVEPCLQWALDNNETGIWGSPSGLKRREIRRARLTAAEYLDNAHHATKKASA